MQTSIVSFGDVPSLRKARTEALQGYQRDRVAAAVRERRLLIADEMGLGKTAAALTALDEAGAFPAVIVTPASSEDSILAECRKWLPWRTSASTGQALPDTEIVVLHPEQLEVHRKALFRLRPKGLVLDESHYFKNPQSGRGRLAKQLARRCSLRILLSGTPIKNWRDDLVHQLDILGCTRDVLRKAYSLAGSKVPDLRTQALVAMAVKRAPRQALHQALVETVMHRATHETEKTGIIPVERHQGAASRPEARSTASWRSSSSRTARKSPSSSPTRSGSAPAPASGPALC